jgi:Pyrimidine dimer DNA glycosylase
MQTFLPYSDYTKSAKSLDYKRLGKQRVEVKQILNALDGLSKGWTNHPATKMWRGYEGQLAIYGSIVCTEWIKLGYKDSLLPFFTDRIKVESMNTNLPKPYWLGDIGLHQSHQSNLIRKDPNFYIPVFGNVPDNLPYYWPVD